MSVLPFQGVRAVLFDLDGTLADTAPDLARAANTMRRARGLAPLPLSALRPVASHGARGLLKVALDVTPSDADYAQMRTEFLANYESALCVESTLFAGVDSVLEDLAKRGLAWGIVTNKATQFTTPLVAALGLVPRAATVVAGDTTPHSKPHPAPLLFAAQALKVFPDACIYVGDDVRDIQAGRAAGMRTVAAAYGYCADSDPALWGADATICVPQALLELLVH
jgi:phosphoglycolate phosphatase